MRLATLEDGTRDGRLVVVGSAGQTFASAEGIALTLQAALDDWDRCELALRARAEELHQGEIHGEPLSSALLMAPLPRAYEWIDGSAFLHHVRLARRARGAPLPEDLESNPLAYQGGSGVLSGPHDPLLAIAGEGGADAGLDFEGEVAVVLGDVPRGTTAETASRHVRLVALVNDVTYRGLVPRELKKGFGFLVSKPATAFAPFFVTPDELGFAVSGERAAGSRSPAWRDGRAFLRLECTLSGARVGTLDTGSGMHFSFYDLIAHVAQTRALVAGTLLGSGTVSNEDESRGVACLVEARARETIACGTPRTPYMRAGDVVRIEAFDDSGRSVFGAIEQRVIAG